MNLLLIVLNAAQLDRQLALVPQLKLLRVPLLLALNMADEADSLGIRIDTEKLAAALGLPVFLISAKYGHGFAQTLETVVSLLNHSPSTNGAHPAVTGCAKCHDCSLALDSAAVEGLDAIVSASVHLPRNLPEGWTGKIDRVLLHPSFGLPLFFAAIFLGFELVYNIGSRLQNVLSLTLYSVKLELLAPALAGAPVLVRSFLLEGLYDGVGTVISFLPIIVAFLVFMAIVEDTGYLARAAFLMDAFMARLGLDGRSFVIQLMGFGCNVPAIMATRVMRSRGLRLLTMMVIPFSLCSARLQVFLFFTAAVFSRRAAPVVLFSLYLVSFAVVILTALTWRGRYRDREPLMLEPPALPLANGAAVADPGMAGIETLSGRGQRLHPSRRDRGLVPDSLPDRCSGREHPATLAGRSGRLDGSDFPAAWHRTAVEPNAVVRIRGQRDCDWGARGYLRLGPGKPCRCPRSASGLGARL